MKKIWILIRPDWADEAISALSEAGLLHVSHLNPPGGEDISIIREKMELFDEAISILRRTGVAPETGKRRLSEEGALDDARRAIELSAEIDGLRDDIARLESELGAARLWGDFDPREADELKGAGIEITLFSCREDELGRMPEDADYTVVKRVDGSCLCAAFSQGRAEILFKKIPLPVNSPLELDGMVGGKRSELATLEGELERLARVISLFEEAYKRLSRRLQFEEVRSGMGAQEGVAYIRGFVPAGRVEGIAVLASGKGWGMVTEDPEEDDPVPTLVRHSRLSALFQPVMSFIGITPGYFEYDTNAIFLVFFSLFFAMIVGDGGYGLILMAAVFAASKLIPALSRDGIKLFYLLSGTTLLWGAATGNWFGLAASDLPLLGNLVVPGLSAIDATSDKTVMEICFLLAFLHLSAAHLWKGLRYYPNLRMLSEAGWVLLLMGIYILTRFLILKEGSFEPSLYLMISGFSTLIIFSGQRRDGFAAGLLRGVRGLPVAALDGVGGLSNMVSYVRLFAVGMASREVALAFNSMAAGVGFDGPFSVAAALLILAFGHLVNMLLIAMSVIVHGIRLNILEFSGHMNIEWSGIPYRPLGGGERVEKLNSNSDRILRKGGML